VPSHAFRRWVGDAQRAFDDLERAHHALHGTGRGRAYATLQVNHAYVMLLSAHFQACCRDLHTEAVEATLASTTPSSLHPVLRDALLKGRQLDRGNPNPGNLGADFWRLGLALWATLRGLNPRNEPRRLLLEDLTLCRNAIAHQDWSTVSRRIALRRVRAWRSACSALARDLDRAASRHVGSLVGREPW
jgi:hypothetical protein